MVRAAWRFSWSRGARGAPGRPVARGAIVALLVALTSACAWRERAARSAIPAPIVTAPRKAPGAVRTQAEELSFAAWTLGGAASIGLAGRRGLTLAYCCTQWSKAAVRWTPLVSGRVRLRVDVDAHAGCNRGTLVELVSGAGQRWVFPLESLAAITRRCPILVSRHDGLEISITAVGGLRCCGKTQLKAVAVVPEGVDAPGWSERRCGWLRQGLLAASMVGHDAVLAFVGDLPP